MNTRLQVEHPITELVTGIDLVKLQLRIACGEPLPFSQAQLNQRGHAIECRIYAEDPANGFLPATGPVLRLAEPVGPGVRVDSGIATGSEITPYYDPLLAKLIVLAEDRQNARQKMGWALEQYILLGLTTNIPFLQAVIHHEAFQRGETTTDFIEQYFTGWQPPLSAPPDEVFIAAALAELLEETSSQPGQPGEGAGEGDPYSPWGQLRGFRVGGDTTTN
jgi:acetyl/propionyl-CoA carboxylase alpha subunit